MKRFVLKDNREIVVRLNKEPSYYQIEALDGKDYHEIGYLVFRNKRDGKAFLCSIKVTDSSYLQAGVGSIMLQCFENFCKSKRIDYIEGRYYPEGDGADFAKGFYDRHHYSIGHDGYDQYIFKPMYMYETLDKYAISEESPDGTPKKPKSPYEDGM